MGFPVLLISLPTSGAFLLWGAARITHLDFLIPVFFGDFYLEQAISIILAWVFMAAVCIVVGSLFVGGVLFIERVLQRRGFFQEEYGSGETEPVSNLPGGPPAGADSAAPSLGYREQEAKGI
jgi:hypothetical protein